MMGNTKGFEDGRCYKIKNCASEGLVIQLGRDNKKLICGQEITAGDKSRQLFEVSEYVDSGKFKVACKYKSSNTEDSNKVWDFWRFKKELILKEKTTGEASYQFWRSEKVDNTDTVFFVMTAHQDHTGQCLTSNGADKEVTITKKVEENDGTTEQQKQHWKLEIQPS